MSFPETLDTTNDLYILKDLATTTLSQEITSGSTEINGADGTKFPEGQQILTIDDEQILCSNRSNNIWTISERGFSDTAIEDHSINSAINLNYTASHHNKLSSTIVKIEENLSNLNIIDIETDEDLLKGNVVYLKSNGRVGLAQGITAGESKVLGFTSKNVNQGFTSYIINDLEFTLSDWSNIIEDGSSSLSIGSIYFLSTASKGKITNVAPTSGYLVILGVAYSTQSIIIDIQNAIRL